MVTQKTVKRGGLIGGAAVVLAIATPFIGGYEGLETKAYKDIGGVWTVCYGETEGVDRNSEYTKQECDEMLAARVPDYYNAFARNVENPDKLPITFKASITSFVYNVGEGNFKASTMRRKINAGDLWGACQELDRWVYVGRMYVRGLANRREAEKRLCVAELVKPI